MFRNRPNISYKLALADLFFEKVWYSFNNTNEFLNNADIFGNAKVIKIYAGELYPGFYDDKRFLRNIEKSLKMGCELHIIFGPALYVTTRDFIKFSCQEENIYLYKRDYRDPAHFKVVIDQNDKMIAIFDEPHKIDAKDEDRQSTLLWDGFDREIRQLIEKFYLRQKHSKFIPKDGCTLIEEFYPRGKNDRGEFYGFISRENGNVVSSNEKQIDEFMEYWGIHCNSLKS